MENARSAESVSESLLSRIKEARREKNSGSYAVIDAETDPFKFKRVPEPFLWGFYDGSSFRTFTDTADLVAFLRCTHSIVYAHNGGKFDFHFLLRFIPAFTNFLVINGRITKFKFGDCELRDSFSILPIPLDAYKKTTIDYKLFEKKHRGEHMEQITSYLRDDCVNLYELVTAFITEYGTAPTLASSAMKYYAKHYAEQKELINGGRMRAWDDKMRPWYFGGRTEAFETGVFKNTTRIYDINSAYAFAMTHSHVGGFDFTERGTECTADIDRHNFYLIDATSRGALPVREGNKLTYPRARGTYYATGHEIEAGLETKTLDVHHIVKRIIFPKRSRISFKKYIEHFWRQKAESVPKSPGYIFAKLFCNTLYGKLAANPANYSHYMSIPASIALAAQREGWHYESSLTDDVTLVSRPLDLDEQFYYNVATAASITGFVRAFLWRCICLQRSAGFKVYYCDTDSIISDGIMESSQQLGGWKLEQINNMLAIAGRKLYCARDIDGHWKTASKGVVLTPRQIMSVARGAVVTYHNPAPTFSINSEPTFVTRKIRAT